MTHFGIICPAATGHLNTFLPLGQSLKKRGHEVTLIGALDSRPKTLAAGLEFLAIGESEFPMGSVAESLAQMGQLSGLTALQHAIALFRQEAAMFLRDAPAVIKASGVEALLVDQTSRGGGTVAEFLELPFITICSAVVLNRESAVPPFNTHWNYHTAWWARLRNQIGYALLNRITQPISDVVAEYRRWWKLPLHTHPNEAYSQLAQLSQQPAELEFPRQDLPPWFHFTGPYHYSGNREPVSFPWEKLSGQPLIYASMGTIQNRSIEVFHKIASACEELDAQLVISLGGSVSPQSLPPLPGSPLVVEYAPQLELLKRAMLTITHAGLNTTLESLSNGVPLIAIPIANDQPGVAARIAWAGAGKVIPVRRLSIPRLRYALKQVLTEDSYRQNALRLQEAIGQAGGVTRAIEIIEQVVATGKPVLSEQF
jgi:MGT family glycosyltransferase